MTCLIHQIAADLSCQPIAQQICAVQAIQIIIKTAFSAWGL